MQLAIRNGQIVAIIGATRYYLAAEVEDLDPRDPDRRAITILCRVVLADPPVARRAPRSDADAPCPCKAA
jgi:hypothetical protein